jgi:hypothetical protein
MEADAEICRSLSGAARLIQYRLSSDWLGGSMWPYSSLIILMSRSTACAYFGRRKSRARKIQLWLQMYIPIRKSKMPIAGRVVG